MDYIFWYVHPVFKEHVTPGESHVAAALLQGVDDFLLVGPPGAVSFGQVKESRWAAWRSEGGVGRRRLTLVGRILGLGAFTA